MELSDNSKGDDEVREYEDILNKLNEKSYEIFDAEQWLFVTINTAAAIIYSTQKNQISYLEHFKECKTVSEVQRVYDTIQGRFGSDGFKMRKHPVYNYLSSIVAFYPECEISEDVFYEISEYVNDNRFFLYDMKVENNHG